MTRTPHQPTEPVHLLHPPVTARDGFPLKADHNYDWMLSDAEVDQRAREGHGWVRPRDDGRRAKCGGTSTACGVCRREADIFGDHRVSDA